MARYLVTGIAGFIGAKLAHALTAQGHKVRGIDNFSHGRRGNFLGIADKIDLREADITDPAAIQSACEGMDYVLHQAALASVPRSIADPIGSNHANVVGTLCVLRAAREAGVRRVVYASSSEKPPLFAPARTGDVKDSLADIAYSHEAMGNRPAIEFKECLRQTVEWYKTEFASVSVTS